MKIIASEQGECELLSLDRAPLTQLLRLETEADGSIPGHVTAKWLC